MSDKDKGLSLAVDSEEAIDESTAQYLTFFLGHEIYGINIEYVKEVIEYIPVTKVPLVPDYVAGVANLRGNIVPVLDVMQLFFTKKISINKYSDIIIVELNNEGQEFTVGILIDAVKEVVPISSADIDATPDFGTKIRTDYIAGVGKLKKEFIILLDIMKVLSIDELSDF